jgi:hypothetical protein
MSTALIESLAIDGESFSVGVLRDLQGIGSPPPREEVFDHAQRHGSTDYTAFYQPRIFDIYDGIIVWATFDALKAKLALGSDHVITFQRAGLPYLEQVTGRVSTELTGEIAYSSPHMLKWTVSILCADPRIYSAILTTASYSPSASAGGVVFPLAFPLVFVGSGASDLTVNNGGNFPTPPVFTIDGPATAFSITNDTTGESIVFQGIALVAGDVLTVDVAARTVVLNGTDRPDLVDAANTTWWELLPGDNSVRLHGSGFADGVTTLAVQYRDARI